MNNKNIFFFISNEILSNIKQYIYCNIRISDPLEIAPSVPHVFLCEKINIHILLLLFDKLMSLQTWPVLRRQVGCVPRHGYWYGYSRRN